MINEAYRSYAIVKFDVHSSVADIGAGAGKLSELLVERGTLH